MTEKPKIIVATKSKYKIAEFKNFFGDEYELVTPADLGFIDDIEGTGNSYVENAKIKAETIHKLFPYYAVTGDDSGLEVDALNGAPGLYSARFAGDHDVIGGRKKVLELLKGKDNLKCKMKCTLYAILPDGSTTTAVAEMPGTICLDPKDITVGFGFEPIFIPDGFTRPFSEMPDFVKLSISHRKRAYDILHAKVNENLELCKIRPSTRKRNKKEERKLKNAVVRASKKVVFYESEFAIDVIKRMTDLFAYYYCDHRELCAQIPDSIEEIDKYGFDFRDYLYNIRALFKLADYYENECDDESVLLLPDELNRAALELFTKYYKGWWD